jgi:hypothetical protein
VLPLRDTRGLPDPDVRPPVIAEPGDPFAALRVVDLVARMPRGEPVRLRDLVDHLNATYVDWSFGRGAVISAIVQLQANWLSDYRNSDGIVIEDGPFGPTVTIEDSPRVDGWIARQAHRLADSCTERLRAFAVEEGAIP